MNLQFLKMYVIFYVVWSLRVEIVYVTECDKRQPLSNGSCVCESNHLAEESTYPLQCGDGLFPGSRRKMTCKADRSPDTNVVSYYWSENTTSFERAATIRYFIMQF